jgi:2-methylcitrate dehydratase PrpD
LAPERISSIAVRVPRAGKLYPGCDHRGPFAHVLQAKMSIQYNVAAALMQGSVSEKNFALLNDPVLQRLVGLTTLEVDDELTQAYPGQQGGDVEVSEIGGATHRVRLADVVNATAAGVRERFRTAAEDVVGAAQAREIERGIDELDRSDDVGRLATLLRAKAR